MRHIPKSLIALSVFTNRVIGGEKGLSICATLYKKRSKKQKLGVWGVAVVDRIFFWDKDHCRKAFLMRPSPKLNPSVRVLNGVTYHLQDDGVQYKPE